MPGVGRGGVTIGRFRTGAEPKPRWETTKLSQEVADDLRSGLEQIEEVLGDLQERA